MAYIYTHQGKMDIAKDYYMKGLQFLEKVNDLKKKKICMARVYEGMGLIDYTMKDYSKALISYQKALKMFQGAALRNNVAICYMILGKIYEKNGNKDKAGQSYYKEMQTEKKVKLNNDTLSSYDDIVSVNTYE